MNNHLKLLSLIAMPLAYLFSSNSLAANDLGINAGSFTILPSLESHNEWKSNIYSSQAGAIDDVIFHTKPSLLVQSDWTRHLLAFTATADIQNYANYDAEDRNIYTLGVNGKIDIVRDSFLDARFSYSNQYENRGAPDSVFKDVIALAPTNYELIEGSMGYQYKLNRLKIALDNTSQHYGYKNGMTGNSAVINNDKNRSRLQNISTLRLGYELFSGYEAFVRASYNITDYDFNFNSTGLLDERLSANNYNRSSIGYNFNGGIKIDLASKLTGEGHFGYQLRDYDDARLKNITGLSGGLSLTWKATGLTTVITSFDRIINETTQQGASGFFSNSFKINIEHELLRNVLLYSSFTYSNNDYTGGGEFNINKKNRQEDVYGANVWAKYLMNRHLYFMLGYSFNTRSTNVTGTNYDLEVAYFTIGTQF